MTVCAYPGCDATLAFRNSSRVCRQHTHKAPYCRCAICMGSAAKPGPKTGGSHQSGAKSMSMVLSPTSRFEIRMENAAEDLLETALHRRNWTVSTRDRVATFLARLVREEIRTGKDT